MGETKPICEFWQYFFLEKLSKSTNWTFFPHFGTNHKNKATFFTPTFKVEGIKVVLFS